MTLLASLFAFVQTPAGAALLAEVPTLVTDVIGIWHKSGQLTTQMIADYIASGQSFDVLVPRKV